MSWRASYAELVCPTPKTVAGNGKKAVLSAYLTLPFSKSITKANDSGTDRGYRASEKHVLCLGDSWPAVSRLSRIELAVLTVNCFSVSGGC